MGLFTDKNVGKVDRIARIILAVVFFIAAYLMMADLVVSGVLAVIGLVLIVTALMRHCTLYSLLGVSTLKK
jgi:hypothetical protein